MLEQETDYLRRRETHARRMARSARSRHARKAHHILARAYAARRAAIEAPSGTATGGWSGRMQRRIWLGAGFAIFVTALTAVLSARFF